MDINDAIKAGVRKLAELEFENKLEHPVSYLPLWELEITCKPTKHIKKCEICHEFLGKGDRIVRLVKGEYHHHLMYGDYHFDCFMAALIYKINKMEKE